jgi:hypothetical protein
MSTNDSCVVCHEKVTGVKNIAVFDCGHKFHLSCVLSRATNYNTRCPVCTEVQNIKLKADLGDDRTIAMLSSIEARVRRHQMTPEPPKGFLYNLLSMLTPFRSTPSSFKDYLNAGYKLSELKKMGYTPSDCIQGKISWQNMRRNISIAHLLQFGFTWKDMVVLGLKAEHLNDFTWSQLKHTLGISAEDLLKINMTLHELADLKYTPHQLNDLGFTWDKFAAMGANVKTFKAFDMSVEDIKTYFNPTMNQWLDSGFYNRELLLQNGWNVDTVIRILPRTNGRADGRTLRLTF